MLLNFGDWQFDVDMAATMAYSAQEAAENCDCAYCRNYYQAADPQLRALLGSFGLDLEAPDELMPYDFHGEMQYEGYYAVAGRILQRGEKPFACGNALVTPCVDEEPRVNTGIAGPCFLLNVSVTLPWVLDEPMQEVLSPANEPPFLKKMWLRLLEKLGKDDIQT